MREHLGPSLTSVRPRTAITRSSGNKHASAAEPQAVADYKVELLEYEWPDLPPIAHMKDAITRQRVSNGISYLLPVDNPKISINCKYRTDLRAMFQEPYCNDDTGYDDSKVILSSKVHFRASCDNKWTDTHIKNLPVRVNSESECVRRQYSRSAPAGASRQIGIDPQKLRKRSNLFLPIKAEIPTEAIKIRNEAEKIIQSIKEKDEEFEEDTHVNLKDTDTDANRLRATDTKESRHPDKEGQLFQKANTFRGTSARFSNYQELRTAQPPKPSIPGQFKSKFLSGEKNQHIWEWLHYGEEISPFEYFLSVCG